MTSIMWFRRDLRLNDNPALLAALESGLVVPLMVLNPAQLDNAGEFPKTRFLASVAALNESLDGKLVIRHGNPIDVLPRVAQEVKADQVFASEDFTPFGKARDAAVARALGDVSLKFVGSPYAVSPGRVLKADGSQYRVFTPFFKAWQLHGWRPPAESPKLNLRDLESEPLPEFPKLEMAGPIGELAAMRRFNEFLKSGLAGYDTDRDRPDLDGTSLLSPALRFGEVHPRTLLAKLGEEKSHVRYRAEICWREFYADVLHHTPTATSQSIDTRFDQMPWDSGTVADQRFAAWQQGRTGYPMVDAGIRQLLAEGWMHNRVRMVVGSFLVKHLHLEWQRGAEFFLQYLIDGDTASNQLSWQWVAGSGTDAAPYVRIFNPILQAHRFDPAGDYVRKYVPELRGIQGGAVHEPWLLDAGLAPDYPARIVDLAAERDEALRRYDLIRINR